MNYETALQELEQREHLGSKLGLKNITELCERLDNPQDAYKVIHIAGSNGKGSVTAMCANILKEAGVNAGMHTSPHLQHVRERYVVNGEMMSKEEFAQVYSEVKRASDEMEQDGMRSTYFEFTVAMAFVHLKMKQVEYAVIEVGMGGRLDATNVAKGIVNGITMIDLEHTKYLGNTVEKIAAEKGGIIKEGSVTIVGDSDTNVRHVLNDICKERKSSCVIVQGEYPGEIGLQGAYQRRNAVIAIEVIKALHAYGLTIPDEHIKQGLKTVTWPGRLEVIQENPKVTIDGSHTPRGMDTVAAYLAGRKVTLVVGFSEDKEIETLASIIGPSAHRVIVTKAHYKGAETKYVAAEMERYCAALEVIEDPVEAIQKALLYGDEILVTGSLYVAGEVRNYWQKIS